VRDRTPGRALENETCFTRRLATDANLLFHAQLALQIPIRHINGYVELSPLYHKRVGLSKLYAGTRTLFGYKNVQTIYLADAAAMHDIVLADSKIGGIVSSGKHDD
jgi:hypothetical protein